MKNESMNLHIYLDDLDVELAPMKHSVCFNHTLNKDFAHLSRLRDHQFPVSILHFALLHFEALSL
jgi:hypothetical protein